MKLTKCLRYLTTPSISKDLVRKFVPRETIPLKPKIISWFPGHMAKGLKRMQMMTRVADCIIEIHDARLPFTSRNQYANKMYKGKPRILLLNKADLVPPHQIDDICKQIAVRESIPVYPSNITVHRIRELKQIIKDGVSMANADQLMISKPHYTFFVSGIPNSGKSSFINVFKKENDYDKNKLQVAPVPGVTKNISNRVKVTNSPRVYVYDTPGVTQPRHEGPEAALKLSACGCIPLSLIGPVETADYILYQLNKNQRYYYCTQCGIAGPSNNIYEVLAYLARRRDYMVEGKPNITNAAQHFVKLFNAGEFGRIILEDV